MTYNPTLFGAIRRVLLLLQATSPTSVDTREVNLSDIHIVYCVPRIGSSLVTVVLATVLQFMFATHLPSLFC